MRFFVSFNVKCTKQLKRDVQPGRPGGRTDSVFVAEIPHVKNREPEIQEPKRGPRIHMPTKSLGDFARDSRHRKSQGRLRR